MIFLTAKTSDDWLCVLKKLKKVSTKRDVIKDEEKISIDIQTDYEAYLEKMIQEKWPDLRIQNDYNHLL